jgi:hypothetical protein
VLPNLVASVPSLHGHSALRSRICGEESEKGKEEQEPKKKKTQSFSSRSPRKIAALYSARKKSFQTNRKTEKPRGLGTPDTDSEFKNPEHGERAGAARETRRAGGRARGQLLERARSGGADWARARADRAASRR